MNEILLNVVVLVFEVLYYALFMKFARKEGEFWRYLLSFTLITIVGTIINTNNMFSYLILNILIVLSLKYIVKLKVVSYDLFTIFLMLFSKIVIEYIIVLIFFNLLNESISMVLIMIAISKILVVTSFKNEIKAVDKYFNKKWNDNNFYIRYIFTILMFIYVIVSFITIIFY